ncbi:MAG: hypothetical protein EA359_00720 [Balneolaceae bacterium]|nr:MAG: hypothetical protein EA359_00720 [Balneolaceae bacterium]
MKTHPNTRTQSDLLQFQIVVDATSILLSPAPSGAMRAVITGLDAKQLEEIILCIADAGPEARTLLREVIGKLTGTHC